MADIKTLLKEARKFIDEKSYKDAQECCKSILRKDKNNYLALVLLGKSLQDSDQAPLAYQKAIATKSDHSLAWQGLANYYERKADTISENKLLNIYSEILKLPLEEEKASDIITKLGQLGCNLKNNDVVSTFVNYIQEGLDQRLKKVAEDQLLKLLKNDIQCKEDDIPHVLNILNKNIINCDNQLYYARVLIQKLDFTSAIEEIINYDFFMNNVSLREWLCKELCTRYVLENSFKGFDIEKNIDLIVQGIEHSKYPGLLKSMLYYEKGLFVEAYKLCVPLVNYQEADVVEATFLIRCTMMLNKWAVTQKLAANFLIKVKDTEFEIKLKIFLFLSLFEQQKWKQAISVGKEISLDKLSQKEQAALAKCYIESSEQTQDIVKNLYNTEYYAQLKALSKIKQGEYKEAISLLEEDLSENPLNLFYLGKCYWILEQFDKSLLNLLKSAKINAEHADTFFYLGHYYYHYKHDLNKAKKCYEKAHSLNNTEEEILKSLSEVYCKLDLKDLDFELLRANQDTCGLWVNFRLGLHYLNKREWENAILQFRNVIKSDRTQVVAFECLADAYYSRGSFTSALKAYKKVILMEPGRRNHCLTRIGNIHCLLTEYEEAISTFTEVLSMDPSSILALKGLAETWIKVAKKKVSNKLFGAAQNSAQYAISYISKGICIDKHYTCFWNLMAYALIFITTLPDNYSFVYLKNGLDEEKDISRTNKLDIFPQALACFSRVAKINKQNYCSYDLAATYLVYYHVSQSKTHLQIAYQLALACIISKPSAWRNWNLLAKIYIFMNKFHIAQHCFIKALLVTRKWSVAKVWCNLGTLYIKVNLYKLANYCFWRGQSTLPSYPQSWIGQGLIAETIREEEAMDLLRHASRLGYHPESALGYADWVCRTLKNYKYLNNRDFRYIIDGLYAITFSIDLMEWFLTYEPDNACALNIIGVLQERTGLLQVALESYKKALLFSEESKQNIIRLNIARLLNRLERYDEAVSTYQSITEASLDSTCGLALALFKKGLYEESYEAYDTALHWLSNSEDEKSDLLVAMAGIIYMHKGVDDAKTILFHSIQVSQKKPTPYSLFAICSLGILHSDQSLSKLALGELQKYEKDSQFGYDIGFLKSYLVFLTDIDHAIKVISDSIHDHPSNGKSWYCMAQYCLQSSNHRAKVASCCAQRAISSIHISCSQFNLSKMLATASIAENLAGEKIKALILAKKGLHMYPCELEIWAAILFSRLQTKCDKNWTLAVLNFMRKNLDITRPMTRWISLLEKKLEK